MFENYRTFSYELAGSDLKLANGEVYHLSYEPVEDDLSIGLGPQFIVKDSSQVHEHVGRSDDPEVDAGIGMQFQLDF